MSENDWSKTPIKNPDSGDDNGTSNDNPFDVRTINEGSEMWSLRIENYTEVPKKKI